MAVVSMQDYQKNARTTESAPEASYERLSNSESEQIVTKEVTVINGEEVETAVYEMPESMEAFQHMMHSLDHVRRKGLTLDISKRFFFYGGKELKGLQESFEKEHQHTYNNDLTQKQIKAFLDSAPVGSTRILHGLLGLSSENGELLQEFCCAVKENRPLDYVRLFEELGDMLWYIDLMLSVIGKTIPEAAEHNIHKLYERYNGKFSQELAFSRNLDEERAVLEEGFAENSEE